MSEHDVTEIIREITEIKTNVKWIVKKLDGNGTKGLCELIEEQNNRIGMLEKWQSRIGGGAFILGVAASILFNVVMRLI